MTVDWAQTGPSAVKRALAQRYDLVLLDLVLPQLNGLAVLEQIQGARPELPVIVVSARGDIPTKLKAFKLGAKDYVEKPFSLDELRARVRVHLAARLDRPTVLRAGRLELDLATLRLASAPRGCRFPTASSGSSATWPSTPARP
jgi:DNA-binding response OmpR family regulator